MIDFSYIISRLRILYELIHNLLHASGVFFIVLSHIFQTRGYFNVLSKNIHVLY